MEKFIVEGGHRLTGNISVSGSKNSALPILAASLLSREPSTIHNLPKLFDIQTMLQILQTLGVKVNRNSEHSITIHPETLTSTEAPYDLVRKMRASICLLGPLLGRTKKATVSMPGGCVIGPRPVDLHIRAFRDMHANISIEHGYIKADGRDMRGAYIFLSGRFGSSVLATANCMMVATLTPGITILEGTACEPEIVDLATFLIKMGAHIEGAGSPTIKIIGQDELQGAEHTIIPDRIEAGTFMIAAAITGGTVSIQNAKKQHLFALIDHLRRMGVKITTVNDVITVSTDGAIKSMDIVTLPYPGFPTDLQAQMMALLCISDGISIITEKVFPERFIHISELNRLGAQIALEGPNAIVKGMCHLSAAPIMSSDLRASAALVLAGMIAEGSTHIHRIYHIDRGYEGLEKKLNLLGANIKRVQERE
ncbi:MAG: UDP-N-acetylglucosamine 1-carboxyvinyltransferase [Chlamydiota bacterium]|nr:UDP-N-acetylglucosamine 1-carboxyvinyltransferase [Chlamydiota bacterium]